MKRDLFICATPLQVLICSAIVNSDSYDGSKPDFILFVRSDSDRYKHYFKLFKKSCNNSEFVTGVPRFPLYLYWIWKRFAKREFRNIYVANINSVQVQYILSFANYEKIRTFDDGTANISKVSVYYNDNPNVIEVLKRAVRKLTGNRHSRFSIAKESDMHFTLYPDYENITKKVSPVDISTSFPANVKNYVGKKAIILLGTVFGEIVTDLNAKSDLIERVKKYISQFPKNDFFYFPHPRDEGNYFPSLIQEHSSYISEERIAKMMAHYEVIELIGFAGSTQFNMMTQSGIEITVITSKLMKNNSHDLTDMLRSRGAEVVSID